MIEQLDRRFRAMPGHHRGLIAWAALGASAQMAVPALRDAYTVAGPAALWLWCLPLAAWALALLLAPGVASTRLGTAALAMPVRRRATVATKAISRRPRQRRVAQPDRRAG